MNEPIVKIHQVEEVGRITRLVIIAVTVIICTMIVMIGAEKIAEKNREPEYDGMIEMEMMR